ncbi:MAG TPA: hypothetical protein VFR85_12900 [Anaeromyxobacteraceae bacterium]|nr:hypothetical protein [Anaeromyxobacteraceae bacterium]
MRRRAAALWLLAAACSVPLEGAPCTSDANCPTEQRCGVDGKCSLAAAACPGTPARAMYPPPLSLNCQSTEKYCADDGTIVDCLADSSVCSHFPLSSGSTDCNPDVCGLDPAGPTCRAKYYVALTFTAPAPGAVVGAAGVNVSVTLTLSGSLVPVPGTIELRGQGMTVVLQQTGQSGLTATYGGVYLPALADATVPLFAVAAKGTIDEISANRTVSVDTAPPAITEVTITCSTTPCLRDSTLTVSATVTDSHPGTVSAAVSLAPSPPIELVFSAGSYSGTFAVKDHSFPHFNTYVSAQVTAADLVGNVATMATGTPVQVTRLRWATQVESSAPPILTGAAVDGSGNIYLGGSNGKLYVLAPGGSVTSRWLGSTTTSFATAPAVGSGGVWIGDQTTVYLVNPSTGAIVNGSGCLIGGAATTPAIAQVSGTETAFVGSQIQRLFAVAAPSKCTNSGQYEAFYAAPAIDGSNNVYAASDQGRLRSLRLDGIGFFVENWSSPGYVSVGASVRVPVMFGSNRIWSASFEPAGQVFQTTTSGAATLVATGGSLGAPILLAGGDVVAGDGPVVRRWDAAGALQGTSGDLGAAAVSAMALADGDAGFVVPTAGGTVHALNADLSTLWQGTLTAGQSLTEGNVFKLPADVFSTAVFGGADGKVYAVMVDGGLDTGALWPKVHHDTRNTGNAAAPLP